MKSVFDKGFVYVPTKDQGPDYLRKRMEAYRDRVNKSTADTAAKVAEIKPRIKAK